MTTKEALLLLATLLMGATTLLSLREMMKMRRRAINLTKIARDELDIFDMLVENIKIAVNLIEDSPEKEAFLQNLTTNTKFQTIKMTYND